MPETRPISERINLAYVKRKHWPQTSMFRLALLFGGVVVLGALALEAGQSTRAFAGHAFFSSGPVTHAHAMFGDNCAACHVADNANPDQYTFNMPVNDEKCLDCHETYAVTHSPNQSLYNGKQRMLAGLAHPVTMSSRCADCHVEHQGHNFDLNHVANAICTQCHADMQGKAYAPGKAPAKPVLGNVGSFSADHPDWAVLRDKTPDPASYNFNHKVHNDPTHPGMQDALTLIKDGKSVAPHPTARANHIEGVEGEPGKFAMACTFCHEPQANGALMKPIRFDTHCADCHTGAVGVIGASGDTLKIISADIGSDDAKALVRPQQIPHGSSSQVAELVDKAIAQFVADNPPQYKPADKPADGGDAKPEEESGSRRRGRSSAETPKPAEAEQPSTGDRRRGSGASTPPAQPVATATLPSFPDRAAVQAWIKDRRDEALDKLMGSGNCGKCHTAIQPGPESAPKLFTIGGGKIPDRWLKKSWFHHVSHSMIKCTDCHVGVLGSKDTAEVLLPNAASCRQCHSGSSSLEGSGASADCILCHMYHEPQPPSVIGRKSIQEVRQGGTAIRAHPR